MTTFLDTVREFLRGTKQPCADDLGRSVAELEAQIPGMRAKIGELDRERARILVEAGDKELAAVENNLAAARRDLDRGQALLAELQRREGEAREQEAGAAIAAERAAIEAEVQTIVKQRLGERKKLTDQLRALVLAEKACNDRVNAFNQALMQDSPPLGIGKRVGEDPIKTASELIPEEAGPLQWPQFRTIWFPGQL